uniref:Rpr2 domain-containing protein n=1 Tax=Trichobilharzia regenti TaxID=157069 RepID=A0AA85ILE0_TRIRE|nr:unnamed protein product [Trichobilharzia regenti]
MLNAMVEEIYRRNKRNLLFTENIWRITKDTALSPHYNRLLHSFSRIGVSKALKEPPCCRTMCLGCFHSLGTTDKRIKIRRKHLRYRSPKSYQINQIFICRVCGTKEVTSEFLPQEYKIAKEEPLTSDKNSSTCAKKKADKQSKKQKKKLKKNILKSEVVQVASKAKPKSSSVNSFTTFMSSLA